MSAKEMFEELGYECFDDRDDKEHLPLIIFYRKDTPEDLVWVSFDLPDKKYRTNVKNIESNNNGKFLQAINKQLKELGWLGDKEDE